MCFTNSAWNVWLDVKLCTYLYLSKLDCLYIHIFFFTLLISHINHIKYSKHVCRSKKERERNKSAQMTCNHMCITFQHKTFNNNINTNSYDIIWAIIWKSLFSISSWNNSTLHHFSSHFAMYKKHSELYPSSKRSLLHTHIWFFTVLTFCNCNKIVF